MQGIAENVVVLSLPNDYKNIVSLISLPTTIYSQSIDQLEHITDKKTIYYFLIFSIWDHNHNNFYIFFSLTFISSIIGIWISVEISVST
jgi:hypothetical protein